ncbi:Acyl-ACP Thioesterase A [Klebsormidium nitens]|uniref:Acyl-[acyl-carrier-protein] hydrolase n=1 Tax=Klebsormidium nitens TaxID=105231 RepID=A0A1Y1I8N9_KLENI|nr:Acyl-ACP Thioesterase A [Klebsormidium nitens]|eukprot:GAQ87344.1 Acyl-ACP Thioesterase A [Klebsormidium nitens]
MAMATRPISGGQLLTDGSSCVCGNGPSVSGSGARDTFFGQRLTVQYPVRRPRKQETARVQMTVHPINSVRSLVTQWLHRKASAEPVNTAVFTPYSMLREKAPAIADLPPSLRNGVAVKERPMPKTEEEERGGNAWGGFDLHADMFKAGRFVDSGFVFRERFAIRCYEVDRNRTASIETIANLMQEVSANHAQAVGFSNDGFATSPLMRERGMIWVTTRIHIEMFRYPKWGDFVEFDTWFQDPGRVGGRRDWNIRDAASGDLIGCGTSKWVMMDQKTRKLAPKDEEVKAELLVYCPQPSKFAPVDKLAASMKICKLEQPPEHTKQNLQARRSDLDMNHHVNNVAYFESAGPCSGTRGVQPFAEAAGGPVRDQPRPHCLAEEADGEPERSLNGKRGIRVNDKCEHKKRQSCVWQRLQEFKTERGRGR